MNKYYLQKINIYLLLIIREWLGLSFYSFIIKKTTFTSVKEIFGCLAIDAFIAELQGMITGFNIVKSDGLITYYETVVSSSLTESLS